MQEQIHIHFDLTVREKFQELCIVELCLQQVVQWYLRAGSRHRNRSIAAFDTKDANFVAGDCKIDLVPLTFAVTLPRYEYTPIGKILS